MADDLKVTLNSYAEEKDTDIIIFVGKIERGLDDVLINECRKRRLRKNVLLYLATGGGDPNAAYKISRCLQRAYKTIIANDRLTSGITGEHKKQGKFSVFIDGPCKSAGTLLCLGADEIIMSGNAELGPIDIQLTKKDEVGERESGLTPIQALSFLELQSTKLFKRHFFTLRFSNEYPLSTKMATQIATQMSVGLLSPVYAQIDPIRLAEVDRSMRIAREYGERLQNGNLRPDTLDILLAAYPSHGFVIDRSEANLLFNTVSTPCSTLRNIGDHLRAIITRILYDEEKPILHFLSDEPAKINVDSKETGMRDAEKLKNQKLKKEAEVPIEEPS